MHVQEGLGLLACYLPDRLLVGAGGVRQTDLGPPIAQSEDEDRGIPEAAPPDVLLCGVLDRGTVLVQGGHDLSLDLRLMITNSHGWVWKPEGAQRAASMILAMYSSGTGSGLNWRTLRLFITKSSRQSYCSVFSIEASTARP